MLYLLQGIVLCLVAPFLGIALLESLKSRRGRIKLRQREDVAVGSLLLSFTLLVVAFIALPLTIRLNVLPAQFKTPLSIEEIKARGWTPWNITTHDGHRLDCGLAMRSQPTQRWVVHFVGNFAHFTTAPRYFGKKLKANSLACNYRGVGLGTGRFKRAEQLFSDGRAILSTLKQRFHPRENDIIIDGHSVGAAVSSQIICPDCTYVVDRSFSSISALVRSQWTQVCLGAFPSYWRVHQELVFASLALITFFPSTTGLLLDVFVIDALLLGPLFAYIFLQTEVLLPCSRVLRRLGLQRPRSRIQLLKTFACLSLILAMVFDVAGLYLKSYGLEMATDKALRARIAQGSKLLLVYNPWEWTIPHRASIHRALEWNGLTEHGNVHELQITEHWRYYPLLAHNMRTATLIDEIAQSVNKIMTNL